ncbi:hypothetical protein ACSYAD_30840 [Acaryochloris marina NIES-2412]|uniref:hypothetical protein n=1 Tax=Acaryochloris marina TaxID=155978 RepID=UPI00405A3DAE
MPGLSWGWGFGVPGVFAVVGWGWYCYLRSHSQFRYRSQVGSSDSQKALLNPEAVKNVCTTRIYGTKGC